MDGHNIGILRGRGLFSRCQDFLSESASVDCFVTDSDGVVHIDHDAIPRYSVCDEDLKMLAHSLL